MLSGKVDAVSGKGLSTNDYTTTEKNKLAGIAEGATANTGTVTSVAVKMNGSTKGTVTTSGTIDLGTVITDISGKQDNLATQTAYTSKGGATKVPQITTNSLGQVTGITEVTITQPTVNNATLTIQKNGTTVNTFTANASSNVTANITVPTKTSDLTNDSNFVTTTDYPTSSVAGVVKGNVNGFGIGGTGNPFPQTFTYQNYVSAPEYTFVGKGTLENVLANKTNTSILPNDNGEIKTKYRIANKNYTGSTSTIWYFPLCKLPTDDNGNYASAIISGRIGGWVNANMSYINALAWNRSGTGISVLDIAGGATAMSNIWGICDIVIYTDAQTVSTTANDSGKDTVYLKCVGYYTFDLDLELFQSTAEILYDGTHLTTTPTGTLVAQASTSTKRAELYNGNLLIAGNQVVTTASGTATRATGDKNGADITTTYQKKLTAGTNITIDANNVISASGSSDYIIELPSSWSSAIQDFQDWQEEAWSEGWDVFPYSFDVLATTYADIDSDHTRYFVNEGLYNSVDRILQGDIPEVKIAFPDIYEPNGNTNYVSSSNVFANDGGNFGSYLNIRFEDYVYMLSYDAGCLLIEGKYEINNVPYYRFTIEPSNINYLFNSKVTTISNLPNSTNNQYPSARLLMECLSKIEEPIGTIKAYAGTESLSDYLLCNGSAVSRTEYSELFSVIGTTYGTGDGSTTFNLPNLNGKVIVGIDDNDTAFDVLGETGGEKTHTLTIDEMPNHQHTTHGRNAGGGNTIYLGAFKMSGLNYSIEQKSSLVGGGQAHNNLQPYITLYYIIKAKKRFTYSGEL